MHSSTDNLLRSVSRSFYLSLRFLPGPMREPVSLGYLLARFTDTLADAPGLEIDERLAWLERVRLAIQGKGEGSWQELAGIAAALAHEGERELVSRADELFARYRSIDAANRDHLGEVLLTIVHGQAWDATYFRPGSLTCCQGGDDLLRYTYWVAGCVGEFWTKVAYTNLGRAFADPEDASRMLVSGRKLGQALQLINILRDLHEDLPAARCYLPADELRSAGWNGEGNPAPGEVAPVFGRWLAVCRGFLEEADFYVKTVREPRVRFCTRLPMLLAEKTADRLEKAGAERVMKERIKIPRSEVWKSMWWAGLC